MASLHHYIQDYLNDLQDLLNNTTDDESLIQAAQAKWPEADDLRQAFLVACRKETIRLGDEGGQEIGQGRVNILRGRLHEDGEKPI